MPSNGVPARLQQQGNPSMNTPSVKRWSVNAVSEGQLPLTLFCDGRPLTQNGSAAGDNVSPVQYLLISIASCFALSCRAVLSRRKLSQVSFEVVTIGEKPVVATESRLSQVSVVAIFGSGITETEAALITEQAKPLCTVTNTILESPTIRYSSRAIKEHRTRVQENTAQHSAY
jgi:uncharacterized OsmC-like protein